MLSIRIKYHTIVVCSTNKHFDYPDYSPHTIVLPIVTPCPRHKQRHGCDWSTLQLLRVGHRSRSRSRRQPYKLGCAIGSVAVQPFSPLHQVLLHACPWQNLCSWHFLFILCVIAKIFSVYSVKKCDQV